MLVFSMYAHYIRVRLLYKCMFHALCVMYWNILRSKNHVALEKCRYSGVLKDLHRYILSGL